mgnify:CR=1 FL=1
MQNNYKQKNLLQSRRAISPILATVVLLGITVVAGGLVFSIFTTGASTASTTNTIVIENAQAVKGSNHADLTATIKNGGSKPWTTIEMTVAKSDLSEPLLYESLHENIQGCVKSDGTAASNQSECTKFAKNLDNPLRSQWVAHLDKTGGTAGVADKGEGISSGRKFVISTSDPSIRTTVVPKNTSVYNLITGNGTDAATNNITTGESCATGTSFTECTTLFNQLDPITGKVFCKLTETNGDVECKVATHQQITSPVGPGNSVQIYADAFTKSITGLNNQFIQSGDNLVVNIVTKNADGGDARVQTIIKVSGV